MRLIDADVLLKTVNQVAPDHRLTFGSLISQTPTVDAVPVVQSFWECYETSTFGGYKDGEAQWWARKFFRCERCRKGSAIKTNYCPNCGAKMDLNGGDG